LTLTLSVTAESTWEKSTAANIVVFRFLVRDRLGQFAASFDAVLADAGIGVLKIPAPLRNQSVEPDERLPTSGRAAACSDRAARQCGSTC
jgi:hypothetical protein